MFTFYIASFKIVVDSKEDWEGLDLGSRCQVVYYVTGIWWIQFSYEERWFSGRVLDS